jgi:PP-loop superfamily ATP-utilizing enzyme
MAGQTGTGSRLTAVTQKAKNGTQVLMVFSSAVDSNTLHHPVDHAAWTRVVRIEICTQAQMVSKQL